MKRVLSLCAVLPTLFLFSSVAGAASTAVPQVFHSPINILGVEHNKVTSGNWSGYAVESPSQFTEVLGSWVQPTAKCTSLGRTYGAFWVGLDGYTSSSVEQLGTDSDCKNVNSPTYYAWYEMYPAASVTISTTQYPVKPGDTMTASVTRAGTSYTLSLHSSEGWTFSTTQTGSDANSLGRMGGRSARHLSAGLLQQRQADELRIRDVLGRPSGHRRVARAGVIVHDQQRPARDHDDHEQRRHPGTAERLSSNGEGFSDTWAHN